MAYNNAKVKERQTVTQSAQTKQLGIVSEVPMNEWNAAISYEKLNIVTYKNGTFIAKRANVGIAPLDTAGWQDVWMLLMNGVGISSTVVEYASGSTSSPTPPQEGWSTDIPAFQAGQLLWTRLTITYTDSTSTMFYSVGVAVAPTKTSELINDGNDGSSPFGTEAFINSSINNLAAFFITPTEDGDRAWASRAVLLAATTFYSGGKTRVPTQNDYAIVLADESQKKGVDGTYPTTRYSYQGGTYPNGQWDFQYIVNNTSLTQAQVDAINSGITSAGVAQITENKNDISSLKMENEEQDAAIKKVQEAANDFVTLDTPQSITGNKTFNGGITVNNDNIILDEGALLISKPTLYGEPYAEYAYNGIVYAADGQKEARLDFPTKSGTLATVADIEEEIENAITKVLNTPV